MYSAFIAQTLSLSPAFRNFVVYRAFERAGRLCDYKALGLGNEGQPSIRTEAFLSILGDEINHDHNAAEHGRPKGPRCGIVDIQIDFGHDFTIGVENKIRSHTLTRLQPDQLPRYDRHLRARGTPFLLILLCPCDYRVKSTELPSDNFVRMNYGELACWCGQYLSQDQLGAFEAAYFRAFQKFLARVEITREDRRVVSLCDYSACDIIGCVFPKTTENGGYAGLYVTRIDSIRGKEVGLTHFSDQRTEQSRPVTASPPSGLDYFRSANLGRIGRGEVRTKDWYSVVAGWSAMAGT